MDIVYNPKDVNVLFDGIVQTDFQEGDMFTLTKRNDFVTMTADATGNTAVALSGDNIHELTINFNEGSPDAKRILRKAYNRESFELAIVDANDDTNVKMTSSGVYCMSPGDLVRGNEVPIRSITFAVPNPEFDFGE